MKRHNILLIAALTAALCISGCGKQDEEVSTEIQDITVEAEDLPGTAEEESSEPEEEVITDDEEAPGEGYVRSSLTNLWVKEEVANSRPIAVMMPTDSAAQPQYGIGSAGVLYEIMEEGSISRQMAAASRSRELGVEIVREAFCNFARDVDRMGIDEKKEALRKLIRKIEWDGTGATIYLEAIENGISFTLKS